MYLRVFMIVILYLATQNLLAFSCRDRSTYLRQDGELCFEVAPWQHHPVELNEHMERIRRMWPENGTRRSLNVQPSLHSEITRYMDTVIAPFLDTYHRNIQNYYQQLTSNILLKIKEEINNAVKKKNTIYNDLIALADKIDIPDTCAEERRDARTVASHHVAKIYECTEYARASIAKMGKYAESMIGITRRHMETTLSNATSYLNISNQDSRVLNNTDISNILKHLSKAAVKLGYELDLSLTNARRYNEQSCERLTSCSNKARKSSEEIVQTATDNIYHCVYA